MEAAHERPRHHLPDSLGTAHNSLRQAITKAARHSPTRMLHQPQSHRHPDSPVPHQFPSVSI